jgi:hypothetical protein
MDLLEKPSVPGPARRLRDVLIDFTQLDAVCGTE